MKNQQNKGQMKYLTMSIVTILILIPLVMSLNFSTSPQINAGLAVYTADDLECTWQEVGDAFQPINVTWYKDNVPYLNMSVTGSNVTLDSANTTKNDVWICEIKLVNATDILFQNVSATIVNTAQTKPEFYLSGVPIANNYTLYEDNTTIFYANSTDADDDVLVYRVITNNLCTLLQADESTGKTTCIPTHLSITGSSTPAPESNFNKKVVLYADDNIELINVGNNITFYLIPRNDQATFVENISNVSIAAGHTWIQIINGTDEELDVPYTFTLSTDLNAAFPGLLVMTVINSTKVNLTFNSEGFAPTNTHIGNWTVFINITDNSSFNATRPPSMMNFTLEITQTNSPPVFVTNFTNTQGNETEYLGTPQIFESYIYANDSNNGDSIIINVSSPGEGYDSCETVFDWSINTTNSSRFNATGFINVTLTNNHTACRYLNVTATDTYGGVSSTILFLNITNANDPPMVYEVGSDENMSNQSTHLYAPYIFHVNASDPDALTYDIINTGTLVYSINDTRFSINSSTGILNITPINEALIGNWTVQVNVTDGEYDASRNLYLEIINNSFPELTIPLNNLVFNQSDTITMNFSGIEYDNDSMVVNISSLTSFNSSIYTKTIIYNNYSGGDNQALWKLEVLSGGNPLIANDHVGTHSVRVNLSDQYGATSSSLSTGILNFTINNENDAPFWDNNKNNVTDTVSFGTVIVNQTYSKLLNATDYDLYLGALSSEVLTFSYANASADLESISFTKIGNSSANITFISRYNGTSNITLMVTDSNGLRDTEVLSFNVLSSTNVPVFQNITPYYNSTTNTTVENFTDASLFPTNTVNVSFAENTTIVFDAYATFDTSEADNNISYKWYIDDVLNKTIINATPTLDSNLTHTFDFDTAGNHNVTLRAVDARLSSSDWIWFINITNVNRPPIVVNPLDNLTVNFSTTYPNYFSYRSNQKIYDPDEDLNGDGKRSTEFGENSTLQIDVLNTAACSFASFYVSGDDFTIVPTATGLCNVRFNVTDDHNATLLTDYVFLNIIGGTPVAGNDNPSSSSGGSTTKTTVITVPFEQEVDVPFPIKIVVPENVEMYVNQSIEIPIVLENNWKNDLLGVSVNATLANHVNVTYEFTRTYFSSIPVGGNVQTMLRLSNYRGEGPFEVEIFASVSDPEVTDSASIFINSLEQTSEGEAVRTKVTFARDMLSENPECRELNDLLDRADKAMKSLNYKEALNLVNAVINGCKFLMNQNEIIRNETPSIIEVGFDFVTENADKIAIGAGLLTAMTILAYAIVGVQRMMSENK